MCGKIAALGASVVVDRSMWNRSGRVWTNTASAAPSTRPPGTMIRLSPPSLQAQARRAGSLLDIGRKVRELLHLADLDPVPILRRAARRPCDRLVLRLHLDQPVPTDHLLAVGEGPVRDPGLSAGERGAGGRGGAGH